jgi:hypothetical protein
VTLRKIEAGGDFTVKNSIFQDVREDEYGREEISATFNTQFSFGPL